MKRKTDLFVRNEVIYRSVQWIARECGVVGLNIIRRTLLQLVEPPVPCYQEAPGKTVYVEQRCVDAILNVKE
jgi:hypothetical protein